MAHELHEHDQMISGRNIMPWHELGEVRENFGIDDLHRIMGWPVEMVPLITADGDKTDSFATVRKDFTTLPEGMKPTGNIILGTGLSRNYSVLQNEDLIKIVEPFVDNGCALETAGTLKNGQRVWIMMRLAKDLNVGKDDVIQRYILASNDHTGRQSAKFGLVGVRVVCQNTLNVAESAETSKLIRIYHQGDVNESMKTVASMLDHVNGAFVNYGINLSQLAKEQINADDLRKYVRNCFFERFNAKEKEEMAKRIEKRENTIIELFEAGAGSDLKSAKGTWYGAYQAVNNYLNHHNDIALDSRLPSLVWGHRALNDKKALRIALKMAA
jgi:phage/plasmid-like protein (TIGR03299 family)